MVGPDPQLGFAPRTGHKPYSSAPALVFIDSDDGPGNELVKSTCPATPIMQKTGRGGWHAATADIPRNLPIYRQPGEDASRREGPNVDVRRMAVTSCPRFTPSRHRQHLTRFAPWTLDLILSAPIYDPYWLPDERHGPRPSDDCDPVALLDAMKIGVGIESQDFEAALQAIPVPLADRIEQAKTYLKGCPEPSKEPGLIDRPRPWRPPSCTASVCRPRRR